MKRNIFITAIIYYGAVLAFLVFTDFSFGAAKSPIDPCLDSHAKETPKVVGQWEAGKHSKTGVKCYVCHFAEADNPEGMEHNSFFVVTNVPASTCESWHPEDGTVCAGNFPQKAECTRKNTDNSCF